MRAEKKLRLGLVLVAILAMISFGLGPAAVAQESGDDEPEEEVWVEIYDDETQDEFGGGDGSEPQDPPPPVQPSSGEEGGDVSGAATATRTLTRTKKIPGAAFSGSDMSHSGGCAWPTDGNSPVRAGVSGIPTGATITELFTEGFDDPGESENFTINLRATDGDGSDIVMAGSTSSAVSGYGNLTDSTISSPGVTGLGGSGRSMYLVFDPDNNSFLDFDDNDHRICQVWITYTITETYLTDVAQFFPITPCAEWDTRLGLPGYTASEGGVITAGTTRGIDLTSTCGVPSSADGFIISVFLINQSGTNWLNVYEGSLPNNNEAVIVGSPADAIESVSLFVPDSTSTPDIKVTMGGSGSAHAKIVISGYYQLTNQPTNRYAD